MAEEEKERNKNQSAKEIAEIIVKNMKANMEDPDFWIKRERLRQNVLDEVLKKHRERIQNKKSKIMSVEE